MCVCVCVYVCVHACVFLFNHEICVLSGLLFIISMRSRL